LREAFGMEKGEPQRAKSHPKKQIKACADCYSLLMTTSQLRDVPFLGVKT
jgi:hypothetical protein